MTDKIIFLEDAKKQIRSRKKRLPEIEILRSVAMLAVIAIHVLNIPISLLLTGSAAQGSFFMMRAMLIFAVPCFLFVSMLMLSHGNEKLSLSFYKKKLLRIGLPYLLWSILYLFIVFSINRNVPENLFHLRSLIYYLLYGKAYEHLYFMPILMGFFLIAPLNKKIAEKIKSKPFFALAIAFGAQIGIYFLNRYLLYPSYTMLSSTFLWYFSIGFFGLWFGLDYQKNLDWIRKHYVRLFVLLSLSAAIHRYYQRILWQQLWNDVSFNTFFYTVNLHAYMLLATLTLLILSNWLIRHCRNRHGKEKHLYRVLNKLSPYSYGIYLMHPLFTYLLRKLVVYPSGLLWAILVPLSTVLLALLCGQITKRIQDLPLLHYLFGR